MERIKVVVAEDHHVVRTALTSLLSREEDLWVVGEVADGNNLLRIVEKAQPDVLLMDAQMPHHQPVEATQTLREQFPQMRIIVLSAFDLPEYVIGLLKAGVTGYVLKDDAADTLVQGIRAVAEGEPWVSPQVAKILVKSVRTNRVNEEMKLTRREEEVLQLMATGKSNGQIAQELYISEQTVKNHISNLFRKLGVETRVDAVLYAICYDLVSLKMIKGELTKGVLPMS
ncbi:MAG: response regulator transcription factor [Chloroflexi bacterium]|nr:response regulator transcription factor [Chloroflexota bacterium]MBP8058501.1 response regulator transcription factor [Chloroflexota bacterium]